MNRRVAAAAVAMPSASVSRSPLIGDGGGRRTLLLAVGVVFVAKLVLYLLVLPTLMQRFSTLWGIGPADNYDELATNIWLGHGYRFTAETALTLMREPGYPYFLAALMYVFGDGHWPSIVANLFFTSASALLIVNLSRSISTRAGVALVAALLFLLHPGIMIAELRSGVEVPFMLLLLCVFLAMRQALHSGKPLDFVKVGIVLGLTCYVRSTALLFPVCFVVQAALTERTWRALVTSGVRTVTVLVTAMLVLTPWIVRNYGLVGQFIPTATVAGVAMQAGNYICLHEDGKTSFQDLDNEAARVRNLLAREQGYQFKPGYYQLFYAPRDEVAFNSSLSHQLLQSYANSPQTLAKCATENLFNFWFRGKTWLATIANVGIQLPYLLLALYGLKLGYRQADRVVLIQLLLFVGYTVAVYVPIHAQARYSIPLIPVLAIFAAIPIVRLWSRVDATETGVASAPAAR